jgi:hypothetical protein
MLRATIEGEELVLGGDIILGVNDVQVEEGGSYDDIYSSISTQTRKQFSNQAVSTRADGYAVDSRRTVSEDPWQEGKKLICSSKASGVLRRDALA